jgi:hypothetical protein
MAQHDYVIANGTGAAVRSDLNNALAAIVSQNSGATEPATMYAYQWWADTTTNLLKLRNAANSGWITLFQLDGEWSTIALENGTAGAPSIYFKDSGTDTGFYSPGANQVGISTGGTARLTIDSNGNVDIDSNTLYVDAANNRVGLGTSTPSRNLTVYNTASNPFISIESSNTGSPGLLFGDTDNNAIGQIRYDHSTDKMQFSVNGSERAVIDSSGRVGIGTTSPGAPLSFADVNALKIQFNGNAANFYGISKLAGGGSLGDGEYRFTAGDVTAGAFTFKSGASERVRIDSSGRLLVGTSSAKTNFENSSTTPQFQIESTSLNGASLSILRDNNDSGGPKLFLAHGRTDAGLVSNNDELGGLFFSGGDGSEFVSGASITAAVDGTPGADDMPSRLVFSTTADGASSPTERMKIDNAGNVYINVMQVGGTANVHWSSSAGQLFVTSSSERFKHDIVDYDKGLDELMQMQPKYFVYNDEPNQKQRAGFIAEDFHALGLTEYVEYWNDDEGNATVPSEIGYANMVAILVKSIQQQQAMIAELQTKVAALEAS